MRREILVPRFFGSETEYGYTLRKGEKSAIAEHLAPPGVARIGLFLGNGGKMYTDCGLIEYATPECGTLKELVVHELAGEQLVWEAYGNGRSKANTIHKRCSTPTRGHSSGAHESYSTTIDIWYDKKASDTNINSLAAHFATRTVFIGAGQTTESGLVLGQKMYDISVESGSDSTRSKALVNLRDQPHAGGPLSRSPSIPPPEIRRLHVVCGDANLSPWAIHMKFGTTSLVLRLLEHGKDISDLFLTDPLQAAKTVAGSMDGMNVQLPLKYGKTKSALDIQEALVERAKKMSEEIELPVEEQAVIDDWFSIIHALREDSIREDNQSGLEQIDWYTKNQMVELDKERRKAKGIVPTKEREDEIELFYDQIPDGKGVKLREQPRRFSPHTPTEDEIESAKTTPPKGRARLRGKVIDKLVERNDGTVVGITVDWDRVARSGGKSQIFGPVEGNYDDAEIERKVENILKNVA